MTPKIRLGELLVRAGVLDESKLKAALHEQERWGGRLGAALVAMGFLSEDMLVKALSKQLAVPIARLDQLDVPDFILKKLEHDYVKTHGVCPERYIAERRILVVAMADPINVETIDELGRRAGVRVQATVAGERAINLAINKLYGAVAADVGVGGTSDLMTEGNKMLEANVEVMRTSEPARSTTQAAQEMLIALEAAQLKQHKAIRVMAELLIERGILPRDEYLSRLSRRS